MTALLLSAINRELAKRLSRKADDDEPPLVALASKLEPAMRARFLAAIATVSGAVDLAALVDAVRGGQVTAIEAALRMESMAAALNQGLTPGLRNGFDVGAEYAHAGLEASGLRLRFDLVNPHAVTWVREHGASLVTGLSDESRAAVRATVESAFTEGRDVRRTARALREIVGLTERGAVAVEHFRERLTAEGIAAETVDARATRYAAAQLRERATLIARTEIITASAEGQQALWEVARTQGLLRDDTRRTWITTPDELLCPLCEPLHGVEVGLREPFPGGVMNPPRHPACRCAVGLVIP